MIPFVYARHVHVHTCLDKHDSFCVCTTCTCSYMFR